MHCFRACGIIIILGLLALPLLARGEPESANVQEFPRTTIFEPTKIWEFQITLSPEEYQAIQPPNRGGFGFGPPPPQAQPNAEEDKSAREVHRNNFGMDLPWGTGSVFAGGQNFDKIGIRYKGNGTIADASQSIKKSLKLDLDHFGGESRFQGLKTINLHCGVTDPTKLRETFAYGLYRASGVPAPRTALAEVRLTVLGKFDRELLGMFTWVEPLDKQFLVDYFGTEDGLLLKPEQVREIDYFGDDWERYNKPYAPKRKPTDQEADRVIAFAKLIHKADDDQFAREIDSYLEIDAYLRFLAATAFVANADGFFTLGHNYYLYLHPQTGKIHFLPWDLDRALANFPIFGSNKQQLNLSFNHPYPGKHRLTEWLLAIPAYQEKYQALLKELAGAIWSEETLLKQLERYENASREVHARDAKAAAARNEKATGGFGPPGMMGSPPPELKLFVEKRTKSLAAQLAGTSPGFIPQGGFGQPGGFKPGNMMAEPLFVALDTDKDELLAKAEWTICAKKLFEACKKDPQGIVLGKDVADGLNELFPKPPAPMRGGPGGGPGQGGGPGRGGPPGLGGGPGPGRGGPGGGPPGGFAFGNMMVRPIVKRADTDQDGNLTFEELDTASAKLFDEFDKQKSGKLDEIAFGELLNVLFDQPPFAPPPARPGNPNQPPPNRPGSF